MKKFTVESSAIQGDLTIPPSKSHSHRAIIFGAMGKGVTTISNLLDSPDTRGMLDAWKTLGAKITENDGTVQIQGVNGQIDGADNVIDVGNSGIALRFLTTLASLSEKPIVITGDHSIRHQRPMRPLLDGLLQLGVKAISTKGDGFAPIIIQGPLSGGKTVINGRDSQPVSALLIASIFSSGTTEIVVEEAGEIPWINLTLDWLDRLNVSYQHHDYSSYTIQGNGGYEGFNYTVPGDWSSAAFPAAAALVTKGAVRLHNLDRFDAQGDKKLFEFFVEMGASVVYNTEENTVDVSYKDPLKGIRADINDCIDCITILSVVACFAEGKTVITNASVAKEKECNRIECIAKELRKMGAIVETSDDGIEITGSPLHEAKLYSHNDHRMAMSLAVAAMGVEGRSVIEDIDCINKTFPSFAEDLKSIGAMLR